MDSEYLVIQATRIGYGLLPTILEEEEPSTSPAVSPAVDKKQATSTRSTKVHTLFLRCI